MRVNSVSSVYYKPRYLQKSIKNQPQETALTSEPNFKGKFGAIVGGTLGTGAFLVGSFFLAPAAACLAGVGLIAGMVTGDVAEDKINKEGNYQEKDSKTDSENNHN